MPYEYRPAVRKSTSVLLGVAGASGAGKTMTAILMAVGLAYPHMTDTEILEAVKKEGKSRIVFIDTEGGRGLHYAPGEGDAPDFASSFPFDYAEILAPYTPEAYQDAITSASGAGYSVIIVDSMSHEYESEGGIQEIADEIESGVLKPGKTLDDAEGRDGWKAWLIKPVKSPGNWKEPKTRHKKMVNRAVQSRAHVIFCLRAQEKMDMKKVPRLDERGEQKVWQGKPQFDTQIIAAEDRPLLERWVPIQEKRFMYELTASFLLLPSAPGVGHPIKNLQAQFQPMFPEGERLGRRNGEMLADWAHGKKVQRGAAEAQRSAPQTQQTPGDGRTTKASPEELVARYEERVAAIESLDALQDFQAGANTMKFVEQLKANYPLLHERVVAANSAAFRKLAPQDGELFEAESENG